MGITFSGGTARQQQWVNDGVARCTYPLDALPDFTVTWADATPCGALHTYMCTSGSTVTIESWADVDSSGKPPIASLFTGDQLHDFYAECFVHEMGHIAAFNRITDLGAAAALFVHIPDGRVGTAADMFGPAAWNERIAEAIAEWFKIGFYNGKLIYHNRTNWHLPEAHWDQFIALLLPGTPEGFGSATYQPGGFGGIASSGLFESYYPADIQAGWPPPWASTFCGYLVGLPDILFDAGGDENVLVSHPWSTISEVVLKGSVNVEDDYFNPPPNTPPPPLAPVFWVAVLGFELDFSGLTFDEAVALEANVMVAINDPDRAGNIAPRLHYQEYPVTEIGAGVVGSTPYQNYSASALADSSGGAVGGGLLPPTSDLANFPPGNTLLWGWSSKAEPGYVVQSLTETGTGVQLGTQFEIFGLRAAPPSVPYPIYLPGTIKTRAITDGTIRGRGPRSVPQTARLH